jgi:hypothetical protein
LGSTSNSRLRTFTARLHRGHASNEASIRSNDALRCSGMQIKLGIETTTGKVHQ